MKNIIKAQQLHFPLIQRSVNILINKPSKSFINKNLLNNNSSEIHHRQKQKKSSKPSKFHQLHDLKLKLHNKSLNQKQLAKNTLNMKSSTLIDFEQKIKENKRILKKHKLKNQLQKQTKSISKKLNDSKFSEIDRLPQIKSKKLLKHKRQSKKYMSQLASTDSKDWIGTIMKGSGIDKVVFQNPKDRLKLFNEKIKGNDVFENIHMFLAGLQSDVNIDEKIASREQIYQKILKFSQKIKKVDPNCQLLKTLGHRLERRGSMPILARNNHSYMCESLNTTESQWSKICFQKRQVSRVQSSFDEQVERINLYLSKTENCVDELLKNRVAILDLLLLKKLKEKQKEMETKFN